MPWSMKISFLFFFNDTAPTEIYTLSLHDALPISTRWRSRMLESGRSPRNSPEPPRSEEHTSELQSRRDLVCRLLLEKKNSRRIRQGIRLQRAHPRDAQVLDARRDAREPLRLIIFFFFNDPATTEIYTLSLHDALPI